jgi:uncharacterized protein (DUF1778 family)
MAAVREASINIRARPAQRDLIDRAATILAQTRSDFSLEGSCARAQAVMLDQVLFTMDDEKYDQFVTALDAPATDTPRLKKLLGRVPAWERSKRDA